MLSGMILKVISIFGLGSMLALMPHAVRAAGPDDDYLAVFEQLQAADQTAEREDRELAQAAYLEVQARLNSFREAYPTWHPEIIEFRLRYVRQRLAALAPETDASPGEATDAATEIPGPEALRIRLLEARLRQLELEREELQARLREALAPSPASGASPELRRAEDRIRNQQKEIDLLRHALLVHDEATQPKEVSLAADLAPDDPQAQLAALQTELQLERAKSSALELAASALQARLTQAGAEGATASASDRASEAHPDAPETADKVDDLEVGRNLIADGRIDEALLVLGRVSQAAPESTEALTLLGGIFLTKGLPDAAEGVLDRALRIDGNCGGAHLEMARLYLKRSPPDGREARRHYQAARQAGVEPDPEIELLLGGAAVPESGTPPR
jgi:Flp pilus assembly protein TadD